MRRSRIGAALGAWLTAGTLIPAAAVGQNAAWTANLVVQPVPSAFLADWQHNPTIGVLTILYTGRTGQSFRVEAFARTKAGEIGRIISPPYSFAFGPTTQIITAGDVLGWSTERSNQRYITMAERTGMLPEGPMRICARVLDDNNRQLTQTCSDVTIALPNPPQLIFPGNRASVTALQPVFQWAPVIVPPQLGATYHLRIAERLPQQTPATALAANIPVFDDQVGSAPIFTYPLDALPLEAGKQYVWQVTAVDQSGDPITRNGGKSQIRSFTLNSPGGTGEAVAGAFPDTLTLVPGLATLSGLANVTVTETPFAYELDGRAVLHLLAPFSAVAHVTLNGLEIDKTSLSAPVLRGGSLRGRVRASFVPAPFANPYVQFTEVAFDTKTGLTLHGAVNLPNFSVPLTGAVQVTATGLSGRLEATAASGQALASFGTDPARYLLRHVEVTLPGGQLSGAGAVELFGQDIGCVGASANVDPSGKLAVSVSCRPHRAVRLVPDVSRFQLALGSVSGNFSITPSSGAVTYGLSAAGDLSLDAGGEACGGSLALTITDGTVSAGPFSASCDPSQSSAALGWLNLGLANLRLQKLSYQSGTGFDFALLVDVTPSLAAVPDLELPQAVDVTIDKHGMTIPATDVTVTRPPVTLAGFGLQVQHVSLPSFTLSWKDWQAHSADGFAFGVQGKVTYAGLPGGAPACLAGVPLAIDNASLGSGGFTATIGDHTFTPSCELQVGGGLAVRIDKVGGTLGVALAPQVAVTQAPSIQGALMLPDYFTCPAGTPKQIAMAGGVALGSDGTLTGRVSGLSPPCPIALAAVQLSLADAALEFAAGPSGAQSAVLSGGATATFTAGAGGQPVRGSGTASVDLIQGKLTSGALNFQGPFELDLPQHPSFLAFQVGSATLDSSGLRVDGRGKLLLPNQQTIDVTFDQVTINPRTVALTGGRVLFDTPFALELGIDTTGALAWHALAKGAPLDVSSGIRVDLPSQLVLAAGGLATSGDAQAHIVYGGRDLDSVTATFSQDFALALDPPAVAAGSVSFAWKGASVATVDARGFHPDLAALATQILPAQLGLPVTNVAYLQLRDANDSLLVSSEQVSGGVHVFTAPGKTVALVLPALQLGRPTPPRVNVALDVTVDPTTGRIAAGSIKVKVPAATMKDFDLTPEGLPFAIDSLAYEPDAGGTYQFTLAGALTLFGARQGNEVTLQLDGAGKMNGTVSVTPSPSERLPLVSDFDRLALTVSSVSGTFDAALLGGPLTYDLTVAGKLSVGEAGGQEYTAGATLDVSNTGVGLSSLTLPTGSSVPYVDVGVLRLGLSNLQVPRFSYDWTTGKWDFDLTFDAALQFPQLDSLTLPTVQGIELTPNGFTIPTINMPQLAIAPVKVAGFQVTPVAFRTKSPVTYDWFTGTAPTEWGFGFDLELGFGASAPTPLRNLTLSVLNAGMTNGVFTGQIEPPTLANPLQVPWGTIDQLDGALKAGQRTVNGVARQVQAIRVGAKGHYHYPSLLRCAAAPADTAAAVSVRINAAGLLAGSVQNVVPSCPVQLGPLAVQITNSSLHFRASRHTQYIDLAGTASLSLPSPVAGQTISASGQLGVDLVQGKVDSGSITLDQAFRWSFPRDNPLLTFDVASGKLDQTGFTLSGSGGLMLGGTDSVVATLHDLVLGLPDLAVKAGSVTVASGFALTAGIGPSGALQWHAAKRDAAQPASPSLLVTTPDTVVLDPSGLRLGGTATAALAYSGQSFGETQLAVAFDSGFAVGFSPIAVNAGVAMLIANQDTVGYIRPTGFSPGNIFGLASVPDSIALPPGTNFDVAYLRLRGKDDHKLHVATASTSGGYELTTDSTGVDLVLPALASQGSVPTVNVKFDIVVDNTFKPISGKIEATATSGALFSLGNLGIPLDVKRVAYETPQQGGQYALHVDAALHLPQSFGGADVEFTDITVGQNGLSGTATLGTYKTTYDASLPVAVAAHLTSNLDVDFTGAQIDFTQSKDVKVSGQVLTGALGDKPIFFTGQLATSGLSLNADLADPASATLPFAGATLTPTAITMDAAVGGSATGFDLTLSGALALANVVGASGSNNGFVLTVNGLKVGTGGVSVQSVGLTSGSTQQFALFGSTFALKNETCGGTAWQALTANYAAASNVLTFVLAGQVTVFGNTTTFCGLQVASNGTVGVASGGSASLISSPVTIVQNAVQLTKLTIVGANGAAPASLDAGFNVTLPPPLGGGPPNTVNVSIAQDGTVTGSGTVRALTPSRAQSFSVGDFTFALREVDLLLNVGNFRSSEVGVVGAVCSSDGGVIAIGDFGAGDTDQCGTATSGSTPATVNYGLTVSFGGAVGLSSISVPDSFTVDLKAAKLKVGQASVADQAATGGTAPSTGGFGLSIGGTFDLDASVVTSTVEFSKVLITSAGGIDFSHVNVPGGSFSIANVISLGIGGIAFGSGSATIYIPNPSGPGATPDSVSVSVTNYFELKNARVSIGGDSPIFSGGAEQVLSYVDASDSTYHLYVKNLALHIASVLDVGADLKYDDEPGGGFDLLVAGAAQVLGKSGGSAGAPGFAVLGVIGNPVVNGQRVMHVGLFLAANNLQITPFPLIPLTITGLGGGFLLNPTSTDLETIKTLVGLSNEASQNTQKLVSGQGSGGAGFAVELYGAMAFGTSTLINGQVLVTVTDQFLDFDGSVTVLGVLQSMAAGAFAATGDASLRIGLNATNPYIAGTIALEVNVAGLIKVNNEDANGQPNPIEFWAFNRQNWGVQGALHASVVNYLSMNASLFIGPPGFYAAGDISGTFWYQIVEITGGFKGQFWYFSPTGDVMTGAVTPANWGGYAKISVKASVLGGVADATGWIYGALIDQNKDWTVYAGGGLSVSCPAGSWTGNVWARFKDGSMDAGLGDDPVMDAAIAAAQQEAQTVENGVQAFQTALTNALAQSNTFTVSKDSLAAAYATLTARLQTAYAIAQQLTQANQSTTNKLVGLGLAFVAYAATYGEYDRYEKPLLPDPSDGAYFEKYLSFISQEGLPSDTASIDALADSITRQLATINQQQPAVETALGKLQVQITQLAQTPIPTIPSTSPVTVAPAAASFSLDAQGKPTNQPKLAVNVNLAREARSKAVSAASAAAAYQAQVKQSLQNLEVGLAQVSQATRGGASLGLLALYDSVASETEHELALSADLMLRMRDWAATQDTWLEGQQNFIQNLFQTQATQLHASAPSSLASLAYHRAIAIDTLLHDGGRSLTDYEQATSGLPNTDPVYIGQAVDRGMVLYYQFADAGLSAMVTAADSEYQVFTQRAQDALNKIRTPYGDMSAKYGALARSQADLEARLSDMYSRFLMWKTGPVGSGSDTAAAGLSKSGGTSSSGGTNSSGSGSGGGLGGTAGVQVRSTAGTGISAVKQQGTSRTAVGASSLSTVLRGLASVPDLEDPTAIQARIDELTKDLSVPHLGSVQLTTGAVSPYTAAVTFTWSATHPSGIYEYEYRDLNGANQGFGLSLFSSASSPRRTVYLFTPNPNQSATDNRTFQVGARGGAGYVGVGRTNYTVTFNTLAHTSSGGVTTTTASGGGLASDNTPPSTPGIYYPSNGPVVGTDGTLRVWSSDAANFEAAWLAEDQESGISEYDYAISTGSGLAISKTRLGTPLTWVSAGGRTDVTIGQLTLSASQPTYIKVRAKNGQGLTSATGTSYPIYYDGTPPIWAAGAAVAPATSNSIAAPGAGAQSAAVAACAVSAPPYPAASAPPTGGMVTNRSLPPGSGTNWSGSLGNMGSTSGGGSTGTSAPALAPAQMRFVRPNASDPQSGIWEYLWHVDRQPATAYAPNGWTPIEGGSQFSVSGAPLDYQHQFYVSVVARNHAGAFTSPVSYGPFLVNDPTEPDESRLAFCAAMGNTPSTLEVQLSGVATDPETKVTGYQYRVRRLFGSPVRDWPGGGAVDWAGAGSAGQTLTTGTLPLNGGTTYYVDVRAVNGRGMAGATETSGPVLYDGSAPPTPSASVTASTTAATVHLNVPDDPESGLMLVQAAIGTQSSNDDMVSWRALKGTPAGQSTVTLTYAQAVAPGTYYLRLRSVNRVGVPSAVATVSFIVPRSIQTTTSFTRAGRLP